MGTVPLSLFFAFTPHEGPGGWTFYSLLFSWVTMPVYEIDPLFIGASGSAPQQPDPLSLPARTLPSSDSDRNCPQPVSQAPPDGAVSACPQRPDPSLVAASLPLISSSPLTVAPTIVTSSGLSSITTFAPYLPPPSKKPPRKSAPPAKNRRPSPTQVFDLLYAPAYWHHFSLAHGLPSLLQALSGL